MAEEWQIRGKNYLVTGGASGLGEKKVEALLKEGAEAVAILDINEAGGKSVAEYNNKTYPGKVTFIKCDIANDDSVTRAFNEVLAKLKRIDVIINNAGTLNESPDQWSTTVDVNLKGVISLTWKGLYHMGKDKGGSGGTIINVSSVGAFIATRNIPIYSATKSAVMWYGRCLSTADFYETTGVRILTICYGSTDTPIILHVHNTFDIKSVEKYMHEMKSMPMQTPEAGAKCCLEVLKKGSNGSIWLSQNGEPAKDITPALTSAYKIIRDLII